MNVKRFVLGSIASIFTFFIAIRYYLVKIVLYPCKSFNLYLINYLRSSNYSIQSKFQTINKQKSQLYDKPHLSDSFQIIVDSSVSLLFTCLIIDYNSSIADWAILIGHHVHHSFVSWYFPELTDYSESFKEFIRLVLIHGYIVCGYFGLSAQICLTIDIIVFLTLPTRLIYSFLVYFYQLIKIIVEYMSQLLIAANKRWLTCQIPVFLKRKQVRILIMGVSAIVFQLWIFILFYYLWLTLIIFLLKMIISILHNIFVLFSQFGKTICLIKHIKIPEYKKKQWKCKLGYVPVVQIQNIIKIWKGQDILNFNIEPKIQNQLNKICHFELKTVKDTFTQANIQNIIYQN